MIVYTAIFGAYDLLKPINVPEGWRAICFTDQPIQVEGWEIVQFTNSDKLCRDIKINPTRYLPDHDRCIWIDGNLSYYGDWNRLNKSGFTIMKHPLRDCIYKEAEACIALGKDSKSMIMSQVSSYKWAGYPQNAGLNATGVIIRDNNPTIVKFCEHWWEQVHLFSHRDQLSFNYIAWKLGFKFNEIPFLENFCKQKHRIVNKKL